MRTRPQFGRAKGYIHIDCVDFTQTTTKSRKLEVGEKHTVTVGQARTLKVDDANWVQMAGTSYTVTTPQFESTTKTDVGIQAGMMVNNQGQYSTEVGKWSGYRKPEELVAQLRDLLADAKKAARR